MQTMRFFRSFTVLFAFVSVCSGQLPSYYNNVNRIIWVVKDINHAEQGWIGLGLSDVHDYPDAKLTGQYRGRSITINARRMTGHLGNLSIDMIQPMKGQQNAFTDFLQRHGDGIFSIVHDVPSREVMAKEVARMSRLDVPVLQQVRLGIDTKPLTFTYFDTEPKGKFVLGLVCCSQSTSSSKEREVVSHLAPVIRESKTVSAFWQSLGFPAFRMEHATPRKDSTYRNKPLWFAFEVGYQHYDQFSYEWIIPPTSPPNIYADFLKLHGEGIQHIGIPVEDLGKAIAEYERHGYHVWQSGAWGDVGKKNSGQYAYMDTDSIGGVAVELIHAY